jgi:chromosome segregation ATPase
MQNRSRTSSSNAINEGGGSSSSNHRSAHPDHNRDSSSTSEWQEHKSSSGKVYYYNPRTGVSQWEVPAELRQQQQQQQQRLASPDSELSESSSIRQQENSPSSSASSHQSAHSDSITEDKPLLTPSLASYYKPELIANFNSSQTDDLQQQVNKLDREILLLNESLLDERVQIKICKSRLEYATTQVEAHETKCNELRKTIERFGIPNYQ